MIIMVIDIEKIDKDLDSTIEKFELRKISRALAVWRFFTVAEDLQRTMYFNLSSRVKFEDIADLNYRMKFIYKSAVQKIFKSMDNYDVPVHSLGKGSVFYEDYFDLIKKCEDYSIKVDFISRLYGDEIYLDENEDNKYKFKYKKETLLYEYSCLEILSNGRVVDDPFLKTLLNLFYNKEKSNFKFFIYNLFCENIQLKKRKIHKKLDTCLLKKLETKVGKYTREGVFNGNFIYKWGIQILLEIL